MKGGGLDKRTGEAVNLPDGIDLPTVAGTLGLEKKEAGRWKVERDAQRTAQTATAILRFHLQPGFPVPPLSGLLTPFPPGLAYARQILK